MIQANELCTCGEPSASLDIRVHVRTTHGVTNTVRLQEGICKFRFSEGSLQESLYDSIVQRLSPIWMVAVERFQGRKAHFRVNRAAGVTNAMDLVFGFPVCRKNYGKPIWRKDRCPERDGSRSW
jgi:hypothetical protein